MSNFSPDQPYNDLPLLPLWGEIETKVVLKAYLEAYAAIAELKHKTVWWINSQPNNADWHALIIHL